ncbi:SAM-dependent methyltransferase [Streptomyces sp. NBC_01476]|uniref:SAM-dependent methyltransferase n=1 Tax=Streptomyces sp. NBC_01476 TaxID=2903881 RepID=UPI003FCDE622
MNAPSVSRIYDYFLGGSHNFEVDREAARAALLAMPSAPKISQANRAVMRRAVRFAMSRGITQFLDIGSGIPTFGNVHEVAQGIDPDARVVYVDYDPVAVAHSRAVLEKVDNATVAAADLREPQSILDHPETRRLLDFDRPVALMLVAVVHFLPDSAHPAEAIATLRDALAPGSVMVMTHATLEHGHTPDGQRGVQQAYQRTGTPLLMRSVAELEPFFAGFEIVEPGIVPLPYWRPDTPEPEIEDPAVLHGLAGVGLKA